MYIGVTGFTAREQVHEAITSVTPDLTRPLMIGVLASYHTPGGQSDVFARQTPRQEDISTIFVNGPNVLNMVHFYTNDQSNLARQLWRATEWGGPYCDGIQLNIVWPDPKALHNLRTRWPDAIMVLQINQRALMACNNSVQQVAYRVCERYGALVDYVLIDASGGRGIVLNPMVASMYLVELASRRDALGLSFKLVVAGGLCADNFQALIEPIRMMIPEIGVDSQGALMTDGSIDSRKVTQYLQTAYRFLT